MLQLSRSLATALLCCSAIFAAAAHAAASQPSPLQLAQFTVRDATNGIEWLRCTTGQNWNGVTCSGEARLLTFGEAERATAIASEELGGRWRLPTRAELETLLCDACTDVKIDARSYPRTPPAPFWSATPNWFSSAHHWTVNFRNGYGASRNPPGMRHYLRLVRDLPKRE